MRITVCIPTYNRASFLKLAIQSVLEQTHQDFLIFVADNASTDNTQDVIENFNDARIIYHKNKRNLGMQGNWEVCLTQAPGDYIAFLEDDNYFYPHHLAEAIRLIGLYNLEFYFTNSNLGSGVYMKPQARELVVRPENIDPVQVMIDINIPASSVVITSKAIREITFKWAADLWCMDRFYWRSVILKHGFICNYNSNVFYRLHDASMTTHYLTGGRKKIARASAQNRFVDRFFLDAYLHLEKEKLDFVLGEFLKRDLSEYMHILPAFFNKKASKELQTLGKELLSRSQNKIKFRYSQFMPLFLRKFCFRNIDRLNILIGKWNSQI